VYFSMLIVLSSAELPTLLWQRGRGC